MFVGCGGFLVRFLIVTCDEGLFSNAIFLINIFFKRFFLLFVMILLFDVVVGWL